LEPLPRPTQVDETPADDPDAPSFDLMKKQVGKTSPTPQRKVFVTGQGEKRPK